MGPSSGDDIRPLDVAEPGRMKRLLRALARSPQRWWDSFATVSLRRGVVHPLGLCGVVLLLVAIGCGLAGVGSGIREASVGELLQYAAYAVIVTSVARVLGAGMWMQVVFFCAGLGAMAHRIVTTNPYEPYFLVIVVLWHMHYGGNQLPKEEFERRYYSPPGFLRRLGTVGPGRIRRSLRGRFEGT